MDPTFSGLGWLQWGVVGTGQGSGWLPFSRHTGTPPVGSVRIEHLGMGPFLVHLTPEPIMRGAELRGLEMGESQQIPSRIWSSIPK